MTKPSKVYNGVRYDSAVEAQHAARLDRWKAEGGVVEWRRWTDRIPLRIGTRPVLTPGGRQMTYLPDFWVEFKEGPSEIQDVKGGRWRSAPSFPAFWLKRQILLAMGVHVTIIGPDGQPVEGV